ncbi:hypothetical protein K6119_04100 [Paracrocinitomix mangrovi]|uniref:hypothetical protein n=1 Tax=Paracrocinitomix mangrovi TaxID=2862509 RepID=UPI001EDC0397|nr:hypothetical protein [Paracrocinitomix mangrovi]UKN02695.1 hypothetical protein K6119_04100 [Paracrocinitomix mangrovi]
MKSNATEKIINIRYSFDSLIVDSIKEKSRFITYIYQYPNGQKAYLTEFKSPRTGLNHKEIQFKTHFGKDSIIYDSVSNGSFQIFEHKYDSLNREIQYHWKVINENDTTINSKYYNYIDEIKFGKKTTIKNAYKVYSDHEKKDSSYFGKAITLFRRNGREKVYYTLNSKGYKGWLTEFNYSRKFTKLTHYIDNSDGTGLEEFWVEYIGNDFEIDCIKREVIQFPTIKLENIRQTLLNLMLQYHSWLQDSKCYDTELKLFSADKRNFLYIYFDNGNYNNRYSGDLILEFVVKN